MQYRQVTKKKSSNEVVLLKLTIVEPKSVF